MMRQEPFATEAEDLRRPYAPLANVIAVLDRVRRVNLPEVFDADFLTVAGVPEGVSVSRVFFALRFLGLIEVNHRPTDTMRAIASAGDEEARELLGAALRAAYAEDFARVDPGQDPQPRIISAFKRYEPRSQTERMVALFLGLARWAGLPVLDAPRQRGLKSEATPQKRGLRQTRSAGITVPKTRADEPPPLASLLSFRFSAEDLAGIEDEAEFERVWKALGVVARATTQARRRTIAQAEPERAEQQIEPESHESERNSRRT